MLRAPKPWAQMRLQNRWKETAVAQMLHVSVYLCNATCILETDGLEGRGTEGVKLKLPISSLFQH